MPLPIPDKGETKKEFINRCMGDSTMLNEYPDNPQRYAVCESQWDSNKEETMNMEARSAIRSHHTDTTDAAWDSGKNARNVKKGMTVGYYSRVYAWKDPDGDVGAKSTYKFIHHAVSDDGTPGVASTRACSNGIGVLNGGRGGADIPDADRRGVYNHLAMHLKDAGKEAPELKSADDEATERRFTSFDASELRVEDSGGEHPMIVGYAARFNAWDGDEGQFLEMIQPGAFSRTIAKDDIRCLFNHDPNYPLGRKSNGTLRLWEDGVGLYMECDINPDDVQATSVFSRVKRRDVTGQSFSFFKPKDIWDFSDEETPRRTLVEVNLVDVGPVTFPFYEVTNAEPAYRSLTRAKEALRANDGEHDADVERLVRLQEGRRRNRTYTLLREE
jgi:hypothetical protein